MNYTEWVEAIPGSLSGDPLWRITAYRLALFSSDVAWKDVTKLMEDKRTLDLAGQLYRAVGSIAANISEGYSRSSGKDRARFYEYALGSARESRTWYFNARHILGPEVVDHRLRLLTDIIRLMLTTIPDQRNQLLREDPAPFRTAVPEQTASILELEPHDPLLTQVPLP